MQGKRGEPLEAIYFETYGGESRRISKREYEKRAFGNDEDMSADEEREMVDFLSDCVED